MRIETLEKFEATDGAPLWALIRGETTKPVLLMIPAGPGLPAIHEACALEKRLQLERDFTVVYWDQRGTGKSFVPNETRELSIDDLVRDAQTLITALCRRLEVQRVTVLGFSLGGSVALLVAEAEPARVERVIAVGPDILMSASERFAWDFARTEAEKAGHRRALRQLTAIGPGPHTTPETFMTRVKWASHFGGVHRQRTFAGLMRDNVLRLLGARHYRLRDAVRALQGIEPTQRRLLKDLCGFDLAARLSSLQVPITFFQGRHDAVAPGHLLEAWVTALQAPRKDIVWFEHSAHTPHFEEPLQFREALMRAVA